MKNLVTHAVPRYITQNKWYLTKDKPIIEISISIISFMYTIFVTNPYHTCILVVDLVDQEK